MSSDSQPTLDAFQAPAAQQDPEGTPDTPERRAPSGAVYGRSQSPAVSHGDEPAAKPERPHDECQNCGVEVSPKQRRLFGDNANVMWHCPDCVSDQGALGFGAGAKPDFDDGQTIASQTQEER